LVWSGCDIAKAGQQAANQLLLQNDLKAINKVRTPLHEAFFLTRPTGMLIRDDANKRRIAFKTPGFAWRGIPALL
jgi:hypothetical protein